MYCAHRDNSNLIRKQWIWAFNIKNKSTLQKEHSWKLFPHEPKFALYITALFKSVCHFLERILQSCCAGCKLLQLSAPPLLKCRCAFTLLHRTYARMQAVHVSRVIFTLKRRSRTVTPNIYVVTETICFLR